MIELIIFIVGIGIGAWGANLFNRWIFGMILDRLGVDHKRLKELARDMAEEAGEPQTEPHTELLIKLEQHNGVIYAYKKDNNQFLAQGTDVDALIAHLDHTFANGARLIVREADGADLLRKNNT